MAYSQEQRQEIFDRLCAEIASGRSIRKACNLEGMVPPETIYKWLDKHEEFAEQYARARERRADARAERIDDTCQDVESGALDPHAARVIIDAQKWLAGKENGRRYGDKLTLDGDLTMKMSDEQLESKLSHLLGKAGASGASGGEGSQGGQA